MNISGILWKGGLLEKYPPFYKIKTGLTPPFIKRYPPFYKMRNRGKNGSKLYKLNYKSGKPFLIKAFLL